MTTDTPIPLSMERSQPGSGTIAKSPKPRKKKSAASHSGDQPAREHTVSIGRSHPLGATPTDEGVNFALFSQNATGVELLLFEKADSPQPYQTISFSPDVNRTSLFWHIHVDGLRPGAHYAYRVDGPTDHAQGHRFNRNMVVVDPYARANTSLRWDRGVACRSEDNVETSKRSVVVDTDDYDWEGDKPINPPMQDLIIYEMHVGGFTRSPSAKAKNPGTFKAVIEKIPYLKELGVTAVELLPIFDFDADEVVHTRSDGTPMKNYWGYSTHSFFAPEETFCVSAEEGSHVTEFRDMVKALHKAGIAVLLDVVYNHTSEGNHQGPTINFKAIDNSVYYHLVPSDKQYYMDYSGCGNTVNCNHPIVDKLIVESLTYWVREMHVDGFRFDEGSILTRAENGAPMQYPPVIWGIELSEDLFDSAVIAEAWDAGGLYQVGYFPGHRWAEWNGKYRDDVRRFVKGDPGMVGALASRIAGSSDLYQAAGKDPVNSINFITAHDGFTLNDLVSYDGKHNWENGENNNDGINDNQSWNCGIEGPTDNGGVNALRERQIKNFFTILMVSQGVPMFVMGDEVRRTQNGNNNAYCQDNAIGWMDWDLVDRNQPMFRFVSKLIARRKWYRALHRPRFFTGALNDRGVADLTWHGVELGQPSWGDEEARVLAFTLGGFDDAPDVHVMLNAYWGPLSFALPTIAGTQWHRVVDTNLPSPDDIMEIDQEVAVSGDRYVVSGRSAVILIAKPTS